MTISATILGRLGADPTTRDAGQYSVSEFRVATTHGFGERKVSTWVTVSLWGKKGTAAANNHKKGDQILLLGCSIYNEEYNGKMYLKAEASDFVFVAKPKEDQPQQKEQWTGTNPNPPSKSYLVPF